MTNKHPHSIWTLGGIPQGMHGVPAPADLESWGETWSDPSDEYLIGLAARQYGEGGVAAAFPALIESQRRLRVAIGAFDKGAQESATRLVETEKRLSDQTETLIELARETSKQTDKLITLTYWIIGLTVTLGVVAAAQLWAMLVKGA